MFLVVKVASQRFLNRTEQSTASQPYFSANIIIMFIPFLAEILSSSMASLQAALLLVETITSNLSSTFPLTSYWIDRAPFVLELGLCQFFLRLLYRGS